MITVDDRIGSKHVAPHLEGEGLPVTVARLAYADVAWDSLEGKRVGLEIKKAEELIRDVPVSRFTGHQLPGLLDAYDYVYLLIEGRVKRSRHGGALLVPRGAGWGEPRFPLSYQGWVKYLNSIAILGAVSVVRTGALHETVATVAALYRWWQRGLGAHRTASPYYVAHRTVKGTPVSAYYQMLRCIRGVGHDKAQALERTFPCMEDLLGASTAQLGGVPGIGPGLAQDIWRTLRR